MFARKETDGKLKVTLVAAELQGGRYSKLLDASPRAARLALMKLLQEAAAVTGFAANYKDITAEILLNREGGCVIYYSCAVASKSTGGFCLQFAGSNALVQCLQQLVQNGHGALLSSLYAYKEGFGLLLHREATPWLKALANQYAVAQFAGGLPCARLREHGQPILENCPVQRAMEVLLGVKPL